VIRAISIFALALLLGACASRSVLPEPKEVRVSRDEPGEDCKDLGVISGMTSSAKGTPEQAMEDLKKEAAIKGANYVRIKQFSAYGTGVTGIAYDCP
jgi:hypothetical protein